MSDPVAWYILLGLAVLVGFLLGLLAGAAIALAAERRRK